MEQHRSHIYGALAEFTTPEQLIHAVQKTREAGYQRIDAFTPFPVEGLAQAMGLKRNWVPFITLLGGLTGGLGGFALQYWAAGITYPQNIGGRPLNSWPAFIPVTFEMTVLGAALCAVFGMLALNRLPQPYHPIFNVGRFVHATTDRFFLCIEARDPKFRLPETDQFLRGLNPHHVSEVNDD